MRSCGRYVNNRQGKSAVFRRLKSGLFPGHLATDRIMIGQLHFVGGITEGFHASVVQDVVDPERRKRTGIRSSPAFATDSEGVLKFGGKQVQGVTENNQRGDSLVTDSLKIMKGGEVSDAVRALTTVLGNREYNSRRGFYNFYIKQMIDMYGQQGVNEGSKSPNKNKKA